MRSHQLSYITSYYHGLPCSTDCTPLSDSLTLGVGSMAIVVGTGFEPVWQGWKPWILTPRWTDQIKTMMEYPSRSNLKCLIVVLRGLGTVPFGGWWIPIPLWIVDIRWVGKTIVFAPPPGFEPGTTRLTVEGSTAELQRNLLMNRPNFLPVRNKEGYWCIPFILSWDCSPMSSRCAIVFH